MTQQSPKTMQNLIRLGICYRIPTYQISIIHIQKTKLKRIADNALFLQQQYECTRIRNLPLIHLFNSGGSITYIFVTLRRRPFYLKEYKTIPKYFFDYSSDIFVLILYLFFRNNENLKSYIDMVFLLGHIRRSLSSENGQFLKYVTNTFFAYLRSIWPL